LGETQGEFKLVMAFAGSTLLWIENPYVGKGLKVQIIC
jgi:hypothetical protein